MHSQTCFYAVKKDRIKNNKQNKIEQVNSKICLGNNKIAQKKKRQHKNRCEYTQFF